METIEYRGRKGPEKHHLYTVEEATELGVPFREDWRDIKGDDSEVGLWVLTDDSMVVEVLSCGQMRTGTPWLRTATGSFLVSSGTSLDTTPRNSRYTFNGTKVQNQPFRVTERIRQWLILFARGKDPVKSYMQIYQGSSFRHAERRVFSLLREEKVKEILRDEVKTAMTQLGLDEKYILAKAKDFVEDVEMSDNVRYKSLQMLADIAEVKPETATPQGAFIGFGSVIEDIEEGKTLTPKLEEGQAALPQLDTLEEGYDEE